MQGSLFLIFACFTAFHVVFCVLFVKETKGLSDMQVKKLYWPKDEGD
jgi:hypothetical protein